MKNPQNLQKRKTFKGNTMKTIQGIGFLIFILCLLLIFSDGVHYVTSSLNFDFTKDDIEQYAIVLAALFFLAMKGSSKKNKR